MKDYSVLDKLVPETEKLHRAIFDEGYTQGYMDGKAEAYKNQVPVQDSYQRGLEDAWECARKICTNWCISDEMLVDIFGRGETIDNIMQKYTALEAIEKIKAYEENQNEPEIAVGDEVIFNDNGDKGVVTFLYGRNNIFTLSMIIDRGQVYSNIDPKLVKKTGRYFPEIEEIIKAMQEGKE